MLIEVFVVPGFGIFGLAGGIDGDVLAGAGEPDVRHAAQPGGSRQLSGVDCAWSWRAGLGMMGLAFATRRYLPKAPLFNRMVLEPPPPEERVTLSHREALADYSHLVGVEGEAVTDLRPAGKALVDDELIDVIALGEPLDRGTPIDRRLGPRQPRVVVRAAGVVTCESRRRRSMFATTALRTA